MTQKGNPEASSGRLIGYARVSTDDQSLSSQVQALKEHGVDARLIFKDKASGARRERSGLEACLAATREGDVLVVWRLDRLGRSLKHLIDIVENLQARGVGLRSLQDGVIDTTTASGQLRPPATGRWAGSVAACAGLGKRVPKAVLGWRNASCAGRRQRCVHSGRV